MIIKETNGRYTLLVPEEHCPEGLEVMIKVNEQGIGIGDGVIPKAEILKKWGLSDG